MLNAANEVAVAAFLDGRCRFDEIVPAVMRAVEAAPDVVNPTLDDIIEADSRAREETRAALHDGVATA